MARPKSADGALVPISGKVREPIRDELDRIAAIEGISRSALLARIAERFVGEYPARES
jgi:hypothetical protein